MNSRLRFPAPAPHSTTLSRRQFAGASAALAASLLAPSFTRSAPRSANDRISLGFIGMGTQNRGLLNGFLKRDDCQTVAVCDVDLQRREAAAKSVNDFYAAKSAHTGASCVAYRDFQELLDRKDIDAVVIATPDHWHAIISIAAAKAGKDIYCEKPLCQSIHEARAMVDAVRKYKRVFQTGSMQRSMKVFRVGCELIQNGILGKIHTVDVGVGGPARPCDLPEQTPEPGLDWDLWLGPAPSRPYHSDLSPRGVHKHFPAWRNYREYGGGGVTDWGAHHFDIAQWGLGQDSSGPVEVLPATSPNPQSGVRLRYANGVEVTHRPTNGVWFHGEKGKLQVNRSEFALWLNGEQKAASPKQLDEIAAAYLATPAVRLYRSDDHKADWIECIRSRKQPICDVEIGARSVTVCHLVNLAYYHGERMLWAPAKNTFRDGSGKQEWLDVPRRGPWKLS